MNKDEVAEKLFDAPYHHLSAWGQRHVDDVMVKLGMATAPANSTLLNPGDPGTLRTDNERLARELESVRMENLDLWDENTELKAQLSELQEQFNRPGDST